MLSIATATLPFAYENSTSRVDLIIQEFITQVHEFATNGTMYVVRMSAKGSQRRGDACSVRASERATKRPSGHHVMVRKQFVVGGSREQG